LDKRWRNFIALIAVLVLGFFAFQWVSSGALASLFAPASFEDGKARVESIFTSKGVSADQINNVRLFSFNQSGGFEKGVSDETLASAKNELVALKDSIPADATGDQKKLADYVNIYILVTEFNIEANSFFSEAESFARGFGSDITPANCEKIDSFYALSEKSSMLYLSSQEIAIENMAFAGAYSEEQPLDFSSEDEFYFSEIFSEAYRATLGYCASVGDTL